MVFGVLCGICIFVDNVVNEEEVEIGLFLIGCVVVGELIFV